MIRPAIQLTAALSFLVAAPLTHAQISLTTAVDLALKNSPRVQTAEADVRKAQAQLSQTKDVFIPVVAGGSGLGATFGFPVGQPTLFNFTAQSLVFNFSQLDYIRAARIGITAANLALLDIRQAVSEDTALTYISLDRNQRRKDALAQESDYSTRLVTIVQERLDAGQDAPIDLTTAKLSAANIRLANLRADDELNADRTHLARLMGLPPDNLQVAPNGFPEPPLDSITLSTGSTLSPGVAAAYANARSKQEQALGDARALYRPQLGFGAQYDRFATNFNNYNSYYCHFVNGTCTSIPSNNGEIGIQLTIPIYDRNKKSKAQESAAEAAHALHDADYIRDQALDGQIKLRHATSELRARTDIAILEQQLAQQQLEVLLVQLQSATSGPGPLMTPKDEQNQRIAEREKYLALVDSNFQLRQAEINLLRQTGQLEQWLRKAVLEQTPMPPREVMPALKSKL
jgi:outer membrane protein TolC